MAKNPKNIFNYSKWDNIELSDDESDLHPNIDKDSWFRMKHRHRLEREEKEDEEIQVMKRLSADDQRRLNVVEARMKGVASGLSEDAEYEDMGGLEGEAEELRNRINERTAKINGYLERRKWNIDNICKVAEERSDINSSESVSLKAADFAPTGKTEASIVEAQKEKESTTATANKTSSSATTSSTSSAITKPAPAGKAAGPAVTPEVSKERVASLSYNDFAMEYEHILETYSVIKDLEATREYLLKNINILLHEHAQSYLLLSSLEDEMNSKFARMRIVARQSQILSHITELGVSTGRDPRDVVIPFFSRIMEDQYKKGFLDAVEDFIKRIEKRAVEKRIEMEKESFEESRAAAPLGPGGLNPYDVLEKLPANMRQAFEDQDTEELHAILDAMGTKQARYWMKQCVDSGLWVPSPDSMKLYNGEVDVHEETSDEEEDVRSAEETNK